MQSIRGARSVEGSSIRVNIRGDTLVFSVTRRAGEQKVPRGTRNGVDRGWHPRAQLTISAPVPR